MNRQTIENALDQLDLPLLVDSWQMKIGLDLDEEPAIWVWVILTRNDTDFPTREGIRRQVEEAIAAVTTTETLLGTVAPWVFVNFRTVDEVRELELA
ncbi:MAG: hypothetical protein ACFB9N_08770 [Geitlerinemataceae cyanobacterium]